MSTTAVEVLNLLSRRTINTDEAIRLLNAIKRGPVKRSIKKIYPVVPVNESEVIMEAIGTAVRSQHGYGNIIMK